jgi:hypothetical protein
MLTVLLVLGLAAFICCLASAGGKVPLWVSVLLLTLIQLMQLLPRGQ